MKRLRVHSLVSTQVEKLQSELYSFKLFFTKPTTCLSIRQLSSSNTRFVRLFGVCMKPSIFITVSERFAGKTLRQILFGDARVPPFNGVLPAAPPSLPVPAAALLLAVADAMGSLYSANPPIAHLRLHDNNVVVSLLSFFSSQLAQIDEKNKLTVKLAGAFLFTPHILTKIRLWNPTNIRN